MTELPTEVVGGLKRSYKQARNAKEKERYQALWFKARGYKRKEICELLGIGERTLGRWIHKFNREGASGLQAKPQRGNHRYLSNQQKTFLKQTIHERPPDELGYEGRFWDTSLLKRLIKDKFKVEYKSQRSYQELFKWSGFSYHKPDKVNRRQGVRSIKEWEKRIKKDWRGIARQMGWYW